MEKNKNIFIWSHFFASILFKNPIFLLEGDKTL